MKNALIIVLVLLAAVLIVSGAPARILDAPHNGSNNMSCSDCHPNPYEYVYTDDTCLSCHTNATGGGYSKNSAPKVLTHSSANTSGKYGTWSTQCLDCHIRHDVEQRAVYGPAIWLVTGMITSVADNGDGTTTFGYSNPVERMPGWADYTKWNKKSFGNLFGGNERGLILYPNTTTFTTQSGVSSELSSATATAMTVKGSINAAFPGKVAPGDPFALAYGQFINAAVNYKTVRFFQNASADSFAYSTARPPSTTDPTVDGICQACHTQTLHWRKDGTLADHSSGENCTICHKHEEGFKISCDACHNSPPATGNHAIHFEAGTAQFGTATVQSTPVAYSFSCVVCHNTTHLHTTANPRTVDVIFAGVAVEDGAAGAAYSASTPTIDDPGTGYAFNYSDGTCSNVYCHGNWPGSGKNASLTFTTGAAPCSSCHGASNTEPPASGSHGKHASNFQYSFSCSLCHSGEIGGAGPSSYSISDKSKHVSGAVDWAFDTGDTRVSVSSGYSITSGTAMPSNGTVPRLYGTCANTYCHSDGTSVATLSLQPNTSPLWGSGALGCTACHGSPPSYPTGTPKANTHPAHAGNTCNTCHVTTTANGTTITTFANHVNKVYDVNPDASSGVTFTYTFATTGGSCTNISCHGGNAATWGWPPLKCSNCHLGPKDVDDFVFGNGITAVESAGQWASTGHGRPIASGNYPQSGNPAADFDASAGTGDSCQYCHDGTVAHGFATNPFRLRATGGPDGQNGNCQKCHKPGSTGYVTGVDGPLPSKDASAATKMADYHWLLAPAGKHTNARNGGYFCWDCHDPHGDMNVAMVRDAVSKRNDWNGVTGFGIPAVRVATTYTTMNTWGSYVNPSGTGVCQVCHEITAHFAGAANYDTNHNPGLSCTGCHTHLGSPTIAGDAFPGAESSGGAACGSCHSDLYAKMNSTANTTYHHLLTTDAAAYARGACLQCHVDHNIFRPDINTANATGRAANLRTNINTAVPAPPTTAGYANTDFLATDADGGICLSCHKNVLTKGYPQPDGTTVAPAVPFQSSTKADYQASAHQYAAPSTFGTGGSMFNADCSKCHNDTMNPKSSFNAQSSVNKFGDHSSTLRRILAALGIPTPVDPLEEQFCYQCHSGGTAGNDYYGVHPMTAQSRKLQTVFGDPYRHDISGNTGRHKPYPEDDVRWSTNRHVECEDCHNPHSAQPGTHAPAAQWYPAAPSSTTNNVSGVLTGMPGVQPSTWPSIWTVPTTFIGLNASAKEYQICFRCHSYNGLQDMDGITAYTTLSGAIVTDQAFEYNLNNKSVHPAVVTLNSQIGSYAPKALASAQLTSPWVTNRGDQTMYCSDCHGTDAENAGDPKGPHGSAYKYMLKGPRKLWPMGTNKLFSLNDISGRNQEGGSLNADWQSTLFCLNCHNSFPSSDHSTWTNKAHQEHDDRDYAPGGTNKNVYCIACHSAVPHGNKVSRLIAYRNQPSPYTYQSGGVNFAALQAFKKASGPFNYRRDNCSSPVNGCHGGTVYGAD